MNEKSYFSLRGDDASDREAFTLPAYMSKYFTDPNVRVLDLGCGNGRFLRALIDRGIKNVKGIDISEDAVAACNEAGLPAEKVADLHLFAEREKGSFEIVLMLHVLEHIEKEGIIPTLRLVRQLIAPGGMLLIAVPNAQSPTGCYWAFEDFTHTTIFTAGSLLYVLKAAGFCSIELVDPHCLEGLPRWKRFVKKPLIVLYAGARNIVNSVTGSSFHDPSPRIWSFEVKMLARVEDAGKRIHMAGGRNR
jgi:SAM-dependent methyltransferase